MLQRIGSQMCLQTFAKRFFGMSYGKHSNSLKVNSVKSLVTQWVNASRCRCKAFSAHLATSLDLFSASVRIIPLKGNWEFRRRFLKKSRNLWLYRLGTDYTGMKCIEKSGKSVSFSFEICVIKRACSSFSELSFRLHLLRVSSVCPLYREAGVSHEVS